MVFVSGLPQPSLSQVLISEPSSVQVATFSVVQSLQAWFSGLIAVSLSVYSSLHTEHLYDVCPFATHVGNTTVST